MQDSTWRKQEQKFKVSDRETIKPYKVACQYLLPWLLVLVVTQLPWRVKPTYPASESEVLRTAFKFVCDKSTTLARRASMIPKRRHEHLSPQSTCYSPPPSLRVMSLYLVFKKKKNSATTKRLEWFDATNTLIPLHKIIHVYLEKIWRYSTPTWQLFGELGMCSTTSAYYPIGPARLDHHSLLCAIFTADLHIMRFQAGEHVHYLYGGLERTGITL